MAKGFAIFIGTILLIAGLLAYIWADDVTDEYETTLGQIGRAVDEDMREEYEQAKIIKSVGIVGAVLGGVFILGGLIAPNKKK